MNGSTRTIGINTEINLMNTGCIKCWQENNCSKFPFMPYYIPFPYPFYNPMMYPQFQNNFMDYSNICLKCENPKYFNSCNSHQCLHKCSSCSSSSCKNCGSRTCCAFNESNQVLHTTSNEIVQNLEERHEERTNVSLKSLRHLKEEREEIPKEAPDSYEMEEISNTENITKYANEFLEKNYRSKYASKSVNETENIEETSEHQDQNKEKQLMIRLLTPNTKKRPNNRNAVIEENDDSDINVDSENENISDEDDNDEYSGKTVIDVAQKDVNNANIEDRRPRRININDNNSSITLQNQDKDVGMLMMLKALVNPYDDKNSPCLNKLLNHIGNENPRSKSEMRKSNNSSPRRNITNKNYSR